MRLVRAGSVESRPEEWLRPGGTYRRHSEDLLSGGGLPFDIERVTLKPGETNWPYHAHSAMWEVYFVDRGRGTVRSPEGETPVGPGDWFVHPPGEPHCMMNPGPEDLIYVVIADNAADRTTIHSG